MPAQDEILYHLIGVCEDAREFYNKAARKAEDPYIEIVFENMAYIRNTIIVDLSRFAKVHEDKAEKNRPAEEYSARFFGKLTSRIQTDTDKELVLHLEQAEDKVFEEFQNAMGKNISPQTKAVLSQQIYALRETHDYMRALKERLYEMA